MKKAAISVVISIVLIFSFSNAALAMSQPTLPHCEGSNLTECSSNILIIFDNTPEFSAIVNYSYYGSPTMENAWVQVDTDNSFTSNIMWDSGNKGITFVSYGTRCQDIPYGTLGNGGVLNSSLQTNTTYFWRIGFSGNSSSPQWSGWKYGRFRMGHELNHHYIYYKPSNVYDSPVGSFPYSSKENWCKGLENLTETIKSIVGDNNSNPGGTGTSSWNLASNHVNVTVVLDCGTGYYMWYYKINEYSQQLKIDGRFISSADYFITVDNSSNSQPVIQAGYNTDSVIIQAPYTRVKNIKAQGSYCGACGFKADGANASYITFDNCFAVNNCYGFYIGTGVTDINIAHDNVQNCKAYDNSYYGIYIGGGSVWPTIKNCTIYDDPSTNSSGIGGWYQYTQYYGIYVHSSGGFLGPWCPVNSCEISSNLIYNNIYGGIYVCGDWDAVGKSQVRACKILSNKIYNNGIYGIYDAGYAGYAGDNSLDIQNNLIWGGDNQDIGVRMGTSYANIVNNTIYAHDNAGIYQGSTQQCNDPIWNNIICVKDSPNSYGIYCQALSPFNYCDYNNIFRLGSGAGKTGFYNGAVRATIADWQSATSYDCNSIALDPCFVDAANLVFNLQSQAGHWNESLIGWTLDVFSSPCLDAGAPAWDYFSEPWPHGFRINIGFDGGTWFTSRTAVKPEIIMVHCYTDASENQEIADGAWTSDGTVRFSWTEPQVGVPAKYYYEYNQSLDSCVNESDSFTTVNYLNDFTLSQGVYYLHVRPITDGGVWGDERVFSAKYDSTAPSSPSTLYCNNYSAQSGQSSPAAGIKHQPAFSAVYNDTTSEDESERISIEVNTQEDFGGTVIWSGAELPIIGINSGTRCEDIRYSGSPLSCNQTYYWRVCFTDRAGNIGAWSNASRFSTETILTMSGYYNVNSENGDFISIQSAVNAVKGYGSSDYVVINVAEGVYTETVDLSGVSGLNSTTQRVWIIGDGKAVIQPGVNGAFILDNSQNISIDGISIADGEGNESIVIRDASQIEIMNVVIEQVGGRYGIFIDNSSHVKT
jgi:hypothetical protein